MSSETIKQEIQTGQTALGIELGSTRIKAVLIDSHFETIAAGSFTWENKFVDGIWTYPLKEVWQGLQSAYTELTNKIRAEYGVSVTQIGSIGVSAMMHGYLAFDKDGQQLVPFRTWRNNITGEAADQLTKLFNFNIPQRWSIAHLYQAILNQEKHVDQLDFMTTLAGYVTWQLSGEKVIGIGDASGMFPIDEQTHDYNAKMITQFESYTGVLGHNIKIRHLFPKVLLAGDRAGMLTAAGAKLLDATGTLQEGALMVPPEGDAGTGMTATNAVRKRTGNISAGTSAFAMVVLDKPLSQVHRDIDIVTTPDGAPVAMVHTNNCTSDINAWMGLFAEFAKATGQHLSADELYKTFFNESTKGDPDCGGVLNFSNVSGENITNIQEGRPLFVRTPNSNFTLANFIKAQLYSAFAPLKIGMDILTKKEHIHTDAMIAQGGIFRTPKIAQQVLADALDIPIILMANAGEGGPWGMAVLALYGLNNADHESLADYLDHQVFAQPESTTLDPVAANVQGFDDYIAVYQKALPVAVAAGDDIQDYQPSKQVKE